MCPGLASATHATTRPSRHTYGLSIVLAPELIWRFSYNGLVAIALPYSRAHGSRPFLYAKRLIFCIPSVYYAHACSKLIRACAMVYIVVCVQVSTACTLHQGNNIGIMSFLIPLPISLSLSLSLVSSDNVIPHWSDDVMPCPQVITAGSR